MFGLAAFVTAASGTARASDRQDCSGGRLFRAGYGVILFGTSGTGQPEALAGAVNSNGRCAFTGHFSGNVNGQPVIDAAATGTYIINSDFTGTMTLDVDGVPEMNYRINWVKRHQQVTGLQTDTGSISQIDARHQQTPSFGLSTLTTSYSYLCSGIENQPAMLLSVTYDGNGSARYSGLQYTPAGVAEIAPGATTYTVNTDGTYSVPITDSTGNVYLFGGVIDSSAFNVPAATISENGGPVTSGPLHCVGQQQ